MVVGWDVCCDGWVGWVDWDGVGGCVEVLVVGDYLGEVEGWVVVGEDGGVDEFVGVLDYEGYLLGCDWFGGDDEVGFVFVGGVVEDDDEFVVVWGVGGGELV